jgi:hypothetical protein
MLVNQPLGKINTVFQIQDFASRTTTNLAVKESDTSAHISCGHVMAPCDDQC